MIHRIYVNKYKITDLITDRFISTVYKAINIKNETVVAIKLLKKENISQRIEDNIRFQHEMSILKGLDHENIIKIYEIENDSVITEYFNNESLADIIKKNTKLNIDQIVQLITVIAKALHVLHNNGIIYRDLKPSHVLISKEDNSLNFNKVKIIDAGLPHIKTYNTIKTNEIIHSSFAYMPGELTGMVHRAPDERSDLYALGILFYQLLTGCLPFQSNTISNLIHQHVTILPEKTIKFNLNIPEIIDRMVFKLIEKEPAQRYQAACGLLYDLDKYKNGNNNFILGLDDKSYTINFQTPLIGREKELSELKFFYKSTMNEKGGICFIKGNPGVGKTRFIAELQNHIYKSQGLFIDLKCTSLKKRQPYSPFKEAVNIYLKTFNQYSEKKQFKIKNKLAEKIGEFGELLLNLSPLFKDLIDDTQTITELESDREKQRLLTVLANFCYSISEVENGLTLFIDDIQWLDFASFDLINKILQNISSYPLLFLCSYRDTELTQSEIDHILNKSIYDNYQKKTIAINPLTENEIDQFISEILHEKIDNIHSVSNYIKQKSGGNPFYILAILKDLIEKNALFFLEEWTLDEKFLKEINIKYDNIDAILNRMSLLGEQDVEIISYASVIGHNFDIELLYHYGKSKQISEDEIVRIIDNAIKLQLIEEHGRKEGSFLFTHDKIHEAFINNISSQTKKEYHQKIAQSIEILKSSEIENYIYDLAHHFINAGDDEKSIMYAFPSGVIAKNAYAYEEALKFFQSTLEIIEKQNEKGGDLWQQCIEHVSEIYSITGKNDDSIQSYNILLVHLRDNNKIASIYKQISNAYYKMGNYIDCEKYAKTCLKYSGENLEQNRTKVFFKIIKELVVHGLHSILPLLFIKKKETADSQKATFIVWVYYSLIWTYSFTDRLKLILSILKILNLSESRIGPSKALGMAFSAYAYLLMNIPLFKRSKKYLQKSLKSSNELNDYQGEGMTNNIMGLLYQWKGELLKSTYYFKKSIDIFKKIGDIKEIEMITNNLANNYLYINDSDNTIKTIDYYLELAHRLQDNYGISSGNRIAAGVYLEMGDYPRAFEYAETSYAISLDNNITFIHCAACITLGKLHLENNTMEKAFAYFQKAKTLAEENRLMKQYTVFIYTFIAEANLQVFNNASAKQLTEKEKKQLLKNILTSCRKALHKTKNWPTHYGSALRVYAEYLALISRHKKAGKFFIHSIDHLNKIGRKYELATTYYKYGNFLYTINKTEKAVENWGKAYFIFKKLNSTVYLKKTIDLLGIKDEVYSSAIERYIKKITNREISSKLINLNKEISSTDDLEYILDKIISVIFEVSGAQRAFIVSHNDASNTIDILSKKNIDTNNPEIEHFMKTIIKETIHTKKIIKFENFNNNGSIFEIQSPFNYNIKSIFSIPIIYKNKIKGACYLDNTLTKFNITSEGTEILKALLDQVIISHELHMYRSIIKKPQIDEVSFDALCNTYNISDREKEILVLILNMNTNKEIAKEKNISHNTVKHHITNIYQKTNVNSRESLLKLFSQ